MEEGAEKLMNTLSSKMESMDNEVQILKAPSLVLAIQRHIRPKFP